MESEKNDSDTNNKSDGLLQPVFPMADNPDSGERPMVTDSWAGLARDTANEGIGWIKKIGLVIIVILMYNYIGPWSVVAPIIGAALAWFVFSFVDTGNKTLRVGVIRVAVDAWEQDWVKINDITPFISDNGNRVYFANKVCLKRKIMEGVPFHNLNDIEMIWKAEKYQKAQEMIVKFIGSYQRSRVDKWIAGNEIAMQILHYWFGMLDDHFLAKPYSPVETGKLDIERSFLEGSMEESLKEVDVYAD